MNNLKLKWLIYGGNGWIGSQVCQILKDQGEIVICSEVRADNANKVEKEIILISPDRVLSFIGRTSGPGYNTIDYLEQNGKLIENITDNLYAPMVLALVCQRHHIHLTYLGTGCIFSGYPEHGYTENDEPDFFGSAYSTVKGKTDQLMHFFEDTVLNLRIRMPLSTENHPRNFITKIMNYQKICSTPNSMTSLPELLPVMINMAKNKLTGTINLVNPGLITHNEILEMVREIIDPEFTWENFTLDEQSKILLAGRSNNFLNTKKLLMLYPDVDPIGVAVRKIIEKMKNN